MLRKCHSLNVVALGDGMRVPRSAPRGLMDFPLILDFLTELQPDGQVPLELTLEQPAAPRLKKRLHPRRPPAAAPTT